MSLAGAVDGIGVHVIGWIDRRVVAAILTHPLAAATLVAAGSTFLLASYVETLIRLHREATE